MTRYDPIAGGPTCEGQADGPWRLRVLDALDGCVTRDEAQAALDAASAWMAAWPGDVYVRHVMEQAVLVRDAWDLTLDR